MPKSKEPKTHFEQVPLEIVKRIVEEEIPDVQANGVDGTGDPPRKKSAAFPRTRFNTVKAL
jgi:hypothetical protein